MDQGVWYDHDWMISTITHPARNAHGPLRRKYLNQATLGTITNGGRLQYFIRESKTIEFDYTYPTSGRVIQRQKTKYFYKKGPNPC